LIESSETASTMSFSSGWQKTCDRPSLCLTGSTGCSIRFSSASTTFLALTLKTMHPTRKTRRVKPTRTRLLAFLVVLLACGVFQVLGLPTDLAVLVLLLAFYALYGARKQSIDSDKALRDVVAVLPGANPITEFRAALRRLHPTPGGASFR
jgi:hypothetical protein